ncbi:MAG: hypothetical protein IID36_06225 [Planctomycetes bacterium]|nr:hypothetical protein [Planctomycetota bacterium]
MTQRPDGPFRRRVGAYPDSASRVYLRELVENGSSLRRTLGWRREQFHFACGGIEMVGGLEDYVRHGGRTLRIGGGRYESEVDATNRRRTLRIGRTRSGAEFHIM